MLSYLFVDVGHLVELFREADFDSLHLDAESAHLPGSEVGRQLEEVGHLGPGVVADVHEERDEAQLILAVHDLENSHLKVCSMLDVVKVR